MININVIVGDITTLDVDVVVNAANSTLLGGGGVDGAIHRRGGKKILQECTLIRKNQYPNGLPAGEAVITSGGDLKASYVIHTVGPMYTVDENPEILLESCYRKSLLLADNYKCSSIVFPAISTGVYGYPKDKAAKVAYDTIRKIIQKCNYIKDVFFVFFQQKDAEIFKTVNLIEK